MRFFASETDVPRGFCHRPDGTISGIGPCSASAYRPQRVRAQPGERRRDAVADAEQLVADGTGVADESLGRGRDVRRCVRGPPPVAMGDEAPSVARIGKKRSEFPSMPASRASYAASLLQEFSADSSFRTARLKIVVSPVRVRVSPSEVPESRMAAGFSSCGWNGRRPGDASTRTGRGAPGSSYGPPLPQKRL